MVKEILEEHRSLDYKTANDLCVKSRMSFINEEYGEGESDRERDREHGKKEQQLREREGEAFSHMTILIQYSTLMKYFHKIC